MQQGNKFLHVGDYEQAQRFLDEQLDSRWPRLLNGFLPIAFPTMRQSLGPHLSYYWTLWQSEWATDVILATAGELDSTMDALLRHALMTGTSPASAGLRYLGRPVTAAGKPDGRSNNEVISRVLDFHDGLRVRHWVDHNSVKAYNEHPAPRGAEGGDDDERPGDVSRLSPGPGRIGPHVQETAAFA